MADPKLIMFLLSDGYLEIRNLRDKQTNLLVTGATVSARVLDSSLAAVGSIPDPVNFTEVSGKSGLYRGSIPDDAAFTNGQDGFVTVTIDKGTLKRTVTLEFEIRDGLS